MNQGAKRGLDLPPCRFRMSKQGKTVKTSLGSAVWLLGPVGLLLWAVWLLWRGEKVWFAVAVCSSCRSWRRGVGEERGLRAQQGGSGRAAERCERQLAQLKGDTLGEEGMKENQDLEGQREVNK